MLCPWSFIILPRDVGSTQKVGTQAVRGPLTCNRGTIQAEKGHFTHKTMKKWEHVPPMPLVSHVHDPIYAQRIPNVSTGIIFGGLYSEGYLS